MIHITPPTTHDIAARAYALWEHAGRIPGHENEHWLRAERELYHDAEQAATLRGDSSVQSQNLSHHEAGFNRPVHTWNA